MPSGGTVAILSNSALNEPIDFSRPIPIFPLPNVVLMPRAIVPLHVFEPRYRVMTREALAGERLIAMAVLKPCDAAQYASLDAEIHPVLCVGRILRDERLVDGRYNFLLQGVSRARVISEDTSRRYRIGLLAQVRPVEACRDVEGAVRGELRRLLHTPPLADQAVVAHWIALLECPECGLSDVVDALAAAVLVDIEDRRRFLGEPCVATRSACICNVISEMAENLRLRGCCRRTPRGWPPRSFEN